jgi:hypothetical protein
VQARATCTGRLSIYCVNHIMLFDYDVWRTVKSRATIICLLYWCHLLMFCMDIFCSCLRHFVRVDYIFYYGPWSVSYVPLFGLVKICSLSSLFFIYFYLFSARVTFLMLMLVLFGTFVYCHEFLLVPKRKYYCILCSILVYPKLCFQLWCIYSCDVVPITMLVDINLHAICIGYVIIL